MHARRALALAALVACGTPSARPPIPGKPAPVAAVDAGPPPVDAGPPARRALTRFRMLRMTDADHGWALVVPAGSREPIVEGATVAATSDGGATWKVRPQDGKRSTRGLYAWSAREAAITTVVSGTELLFERTEDGGATWSSNPVKPVVGATYRKFLAENKSHFFSNDPNRLLGEEIWHAALSFVSRRGGNMFIGFPHGMSSNQGLTLTTGDGGRSWEVVSGGAFIKGETKDTPLEMRNEDASRLLRVRTRRNPGNMESVSAVEWSTGGAWRPSSVRPPDALPAMWSLPSFAGKNAVFYFAELPSPRLMFSNDGGATFRTATELESSGEIAATPEGSVVLVLGDPPLRVARAADGTFAAKPLALPPLPARVAHYQDADFATERDGWLRVELQDPEGLAETQLLLRTRDGAATFELLDPKFSDE